MIWEFKSFEMVNHQNHYQSFRTYEKKVLEQDFTCLLYSFVIVCCLFFLSEV